MQQSDCGRSKWKQQQVERGIGRTTDSSSPSSSSPSSSSASSSSFSTSFFSFLSSSCSEDFRQRFLAKTCSDSCCVLTENFGKLTEQNNSLELDRLRAAEANRSAHQAAMIRRCLTNGDLRSDAGTPDLLQLFNIFHFNTPHLPPSRMLVSVTLVGSIQALRLFVERDASVQDVIKAALKAHIKEGRIPRHGYEHEAYSLHFSPFSLESIDPGVIVSTLGTRSFYLSRSSRPVPRAASTVKETKSWWRNLVGP